MLRKTGRILKMAINDYRKFQYNGQEWIAKICIQIGENKSDRRLGIAICTNISDKGCQSKTLTFRANRFNELSEEEFGIEFHNNASPYGYHFYLSP
jgi:hypothetical protein